MWCIIVGDVAVVIHMIQNLRFRAKVAKSLESLVDVSSAQLSLNDAMILEIQKLKNPEKAD
jgi:hypothetical protein